MLPIVIVAGFGRCGTSLVMQMLEAGGMPMTGEWPAFEAPETGVILGGGEISAKWLRSVEGHAIKVLDPQCGRIPRGFEYRVIWCNRDRKEQAKSQAKMMRMMFPVLARDAVRELEHSYGRDFPLAFKSLRAGGASSFLEVRFEGILKDPAGFASRIATFCNCGLNAESMAKAVRQRPATCAPDMSMEMGLIAEREAA